MLYKLAVSDVKKLKTAKQDLEVKFTLLNPVSQQVRSFPSDEWCDMYCPFYGAKVLCDTKTFGSELARLQPQGDASATG